MTPEQAYKAAGRVASKAVRNLKLGGYSLVRDRWVTLCKQETPDRVLQGVDVWIHDRMSELSGMRTPIFEFMKYSEKWLEQVKPAEELLAVECVKPENHTIPVSNGIFEHTATIREAIWLFLWFIDKTTDEETVEADEKIGYVLGGKPIKDQEIADELEYPRTTICDWRNNLEKMHYIDQTITPYGQVIKVRKSKKWLSKVTTDRHAVTVNRQPQTAGRQPVPIKTQTKNTAQGLLQGQNTETKKELESIWKSRYPKSQFLFWKADEESFRQLEVKFSAEQILKAYRFYVQEDYDPWVVENNSPFGYFAKRINQILDMAESREADEAPEAVEPDDDSVWVILARGGLKQKVNRDIAKRWLASGYVSKILEPTVQ